MIADWRIVEYLVNSNLANSAGRVEVGLQVLLVFIGSLTLGIGGVGVANIMLVSVTERTREIGVRKSVGARRQDILIQFLIEAVTLSMVGGAVGMSIGLSVLALAAFLGFPVLVEAGQIETRPNGRTRFRPTCSRRSVRRHGRLRSS